MENFSEKVNFIWSVADLLRGDYKQSEYGRVILPLTVLRRLDCVLEPTKAKVRKRVTELEDDLDRSKMGLILQRITKQRVFNTSPFTFQLLLDEPNQIAKNLRAYIVGSTTRRGTPSSASASTRRSWVTTWRRARTSSHGRARSAFYRATCSCACAR